MSAQPRCIAVLGAPETGAEALALQLADALAGQPLWAVSLQAAPQAGHDFALLMGLDLPSSGQVDETTRTAKDSALREQLVALGVPYRVVYGTGRTRLTNALLALGLPAPEADVQQNREQAQFDLNRGRTPWSCEKCSDPDCEHKLFTGLLRGRDDPQR